MYNNNILLKHTGIKNNTSTCVVSDELPKLHEHQVVRRTWMTPIQEQSTTDKPCVWKR